MGEVEDLVEVKFRLWDGTDMGPTQYSSATTVDILKVDVVSQWPQDTKYGPKTMNDVKLIYAGKILENYQTIAESRLIDVEIPGGVITMHVAVCPYKNDYGYPYRHNTFIWFPGWKSNG